MHRGISTGVIALTVVIVVIVVAAGAWYMMQGSAAREYPIGELAPLTGQLSSYGRGMDRAVRLAIDDVNTYAKDRGMNMHFTIVSEDSKTDPTVALQKFQALAAKGVKVVVGPMASSEVAALREEANARKVVVISPSSTSPKLAIADDYVFRVPPADQLQGKALATLIKKTGADKVVALVRDDSWGVALYDEVKKNFETLGGSMVAVKYDPSKQDFTAEVSLASSKAKDIGANGLLMISFEEAIVLMDAANKDPLLSKLRWYGTDGTAYSDKIVQEAGNTAAGHRFIGTIAGGVKNPKTEHFITAFKDKYGVGPKAYDYYSYDAAWLAALSIIKAGKYDGVAIKNVIMQVADNYEGVTGKLTLNKYGDRAYGSYTIWEVVLKNGKPVYKDVGSYDAATDTLTLSE